MELVQIILLGILGLSFFAFGFFTLRFYQAKTRKKNTCCPLSIKTAVTGIIVTAVIVTAVTVLVPLNIYNGSASDSTDTNVSTTLPAVTVVKLAFDVDYDLYIPLQQAGFTAALNQTLVTLNLHLLVFLPYTFARGSIIVGLTVDTTAQATLIAIVQNKEFTITVNDTNMTATLYLDGDILTPTPEPTPQPTPIPTPQPTPIPTPQPTPIPTPQPTPIPTPQPTPEPTPIPTPHPTPEPTPIPTPQPTPEPTPEPTPQPTPQPTPIPTPQPTPIPTPQPTPIPTPQPTPIPTPQPTPIPTPQPTPEPTPIPTPHPTPEPTPIPTPQPTPEPTPEPTPQPTPQPTPIPTPQPTQEPTPEPTPQPTPAPYSISQLRNKILPDPATGSGYKAFGYSIALSGDGMTAIVGSRENNNNIGAAYVYMRVNTITPFTILQIIFPSAYTDTPFFGQSVALTDDGLTALVGGHLNDGNKGAVWVYTRENRTSNFTNTQILLPIPNIIGFYFGISVALSGDGKTALVGGDGAGVQQKSSAWAFTRNASSINFTLLGGKFSVEPEFSYFGHSVALSTDGLTALIGDYNYRNSYQGAICLYSRNNDSSIFQSLQPFITTDVTANNLFGISVVLSGDGLTAVVGAIGNTNYNGAVYVYKRSYSNLTFTTSPNQIILPFGNVGSSVFGSSVDLSFDGNTLIIGGYGDNADKGAVWVYKRNATHPTYTLQGSKLVPTTTVGTSRFGSSVSLASDGLTALIGGSGDDNRTGAAWAYTLT